MHELGLLSAMVKTIEGIAQEERLERVEKIVLQVGELSGVVPAYQIGRASCRERV